MEELDGVFLQMLVQVWLDPLDQVFELRNLALDSRLGKCVVVLNAVQKPAKTPETVSLYLYKIIRANFLTMKCLNGPSLEFLLICFQERNARS